jgi:hypothetical protein
MFDTLRFLITGNATQLNPITGEFGPIVLPWNIRRSIVFSMAGYRLFSWRRKRYGYAFLDEEDTQSWEIPDDWFYNRDSRWKDDHDA